MVIIKETKKTEAYTPLAKFGDRVIDFVTFLEGIKINLKRELELSICDSKGATVLAPSVSPADVKISSDQLVIHSRDRGFTFMISPRERLFNLAAISEVSNASSIDYIIPLKMPERLYYRIKVN